MSYFSWSLVSILIGTNTVLLQPLAIAKSTVEVGRIAKAITVEIKQVGSSNVGSGILLQKQGAVYTVLTAGHVLLDSGAVFNLKTSDGQVHQAITGSVRSSGNNIDLAVLKFRSNKNYVVAKIGTSNSLEIGMQIYVAGFPKPTKTIESGTFNFTKGEVIGIANKGNDSGYSLIYSNVTFRGMSGGPVLNDAGELVAIHGQGDRDDENVSASGIGEKTGRNLGIVVERFGTVALNMGVQLDQPIAALPQNQTLNAADYLLGGKYKEKLNDYRGALADYNRAIALNPKYFEAYSIRARLKDWRLNDGQGALIDYNQAIALNPKYSEAYFGRARLKDWHLNDGQGALIDYNQAIELDPKNAFYYFGRSSLKRKLGDLRGLIADCDQSIAIEYNYEVALNCGVEKASIGDFKGALADYNKLITMHPELSGTYGSRADLKRTLGDL